MRDNSKFQKSQKRAHQNNLELLKIESEPGLSFQEILGLMIIITQVFIKNAECIYNFVNKVLFLY